MEQTKTTAQASTTFEGQEECSWWEQNWKKIVAAGVVVSSVILVAMNRDKLTIIAQQIARASKPSSVIRPAVLEEHCSNCIADLSEQILRKAPTAPSTVISHIRNLPEGWHPSPEKVAEAESLQIFLLPNQTLVDAYVKGRNVT